MVKQLERHRAGDRHGTVSGVDDLGGSANMNLNRQIAAFEKLPDKLGLAWLERSHGEPRVRQASMDKFGSFQEITEVAFHLLCARARQDGYKRPAVGL